MIAQKLVAPLSRYKPSRTLHQDFAANKLQQVLIFCHPLFAFEKGDGRYSPFF